MSKLKSTMESCRARNLLCPALPSIALQLGADGPDLVVTIGRLEIQPDGSAKVLGAEQVRCPGGVPQPALFRDANDPGAQYCEYCRAAFGYAVLATVYSALARLLRPDLTLDFGEQPSAVDKAQPKA